MPQAIPLVIAYTATVIGTNIAAGAIIIGLNTWLVNATLIAILTQAAVVLGDSGSQRLDFGLEARLVANPSEIAPRRIIYGKTRAAPQPVMVDDSNNFIVAYAICEHDINRIENLYLNNGKFLTPTEIATLNSGAEVNINSYDEATDGADLARERRNYADDEFYRRGVTFRLIRPGGGIADAMRSMGTALDVSNMRGNTTAFILARYPKTTANTDRTKQLIFPGIPNLQLDVDRGGVELADLPTQHRVSTTAYNAARALYDYASKYTDYGEQVLGKDRIDFASFAAAMAACETEDYEAHGMITLTDSNEAVFEQFMMAMGGGWISDTAGVLVAKANSSQPAVRTITEDHILEGWSAVPQTPRADRFSDLTITYIDDSNEIDTLSYHLPEAREQFGEKEQTVEASLVRGSDQAYQLATILTERAYHSTQLNLPMNIFGLALKPGDVVELDVDALALDHERLFFVVDRAINPDATTQVSIAEYVPPPALPQRVAVEDDIDLANGTATMDVSVEVPTGILEGTRPGAPVSQDVVLWEASFTAGENRWYRNEKGWSDGNDSYVSPSNQPIFGTLDSGTLPIPAGTIPGIATDRAFSWISTDSNATDAANNRVDVILGWQPDEESDDLNDIADDVRLVIEKSGVVMVNVAISSAFIQFNNRSRERFRWTNLPLLNGQTALALGDSFTVKIVQEQTTGLDPQDGLAWSEVRLATPTPTETYWEMGFTAGSRGAYNEYGWSSGTDLSGITYGTINSGSVLITGGTIPGIDADRTVALIRTYTFPYSTSTRSLELGWEPDSEHSTQGADDQNNIADYVYFSLFDSGGDEKYRYNIKSANIDEAGSANERFNWRPVSDGGIYNNQTYTARIWRPPNPDYSLDPDVILRFDGQLTTGGVANDLRLAVIDQDRTEEGTDGLILDMAVEAPQVSVDAQASTTTITLDAGFKARLLDVSDQQGIANGNTFRAVLYRASGPLPVALLKGN